MPYDCPKGFDKPKVQKSNREKFLTLDQLQELLELVVDLDRPKWRRDHAAIYLSYYFGLRVSECVILDRDSFRFLDSGQAMIRTSKNLPRIPVICTECSRRWRVSVSRIGKLFPCPRCGRDTLVKGKADQDLTPPEKMPPVVETRVIKYLQGYLKKMPPEQQWLFTGSGDAHLSVSQLRKVFNFYICNSKLPRVTSFHSLRHGRGVYIYERFKDHVMVRDMLRQKSLSAAEFYMQLSPARQEEYRSVLDQDDAGIGDIHGA